MNGTHVPSAWWRPTSPTCCGRSTSAASASTCGRSGPTWPTRTTSTSCGSTSTRSRGSASPKPSAAAFELRDPARRAGHRRLPQDHGEPGRPRLRPARAPVGLVPGPVRGRGGGPRARAAPARPHHRGMVEGGAGRRASSSTTTRTPRTRPSSGPGRSGPGWAARCRPRCRGRRSARSHPTSSPSPRCPRRLERDGDPWASIADEPQSLEPLLAMHERDTAAGLLDAPVAARVPQDAQRAAPGGAQPGPRALSAGVHHQPRSRRGGDRAGAAAPGGRVRGRRRVPRRDGPLPPLG